MKTTQAYSEIQSWINKSKPLETGLKLYHKYSTNGYEKLRLNRMPVAAKSMLIDTWLMQLYENLEPKEQIIENKECRSEKTPAKTNEPIIVKYPPVQERLKKEFPKIIFSELPDTLKLLVFKRYDVWQKALEQHAIQQNASSNTERFEAAKLTVLSMQENWEIWEELNHWHMYNKVLGNHEKFQEDDFLKDIREAEKNKSATELTKFLLTLRKRSRQNILEYKRKDELTPEQKQKMTQWIWKHDIVSKKLGEPTWEA